MNRRKFLKLIFAVPAIAVLRKAGIKPDEKGRIWKGRIADVKVYDRALPDEEVAMVWTEDWKSRWELYKPVSFWTPNTGFVVDGASSYMRFWRDDPVPGIYSWDTDEKQWKLEIEQEIYE